MTHNCKTSEEGVGELVKDSLVSQELYASLFNLETRQTFERAMTVLFNADLGRLINGDWDNPLSRIPNLDTPWRVGETLHSYTSRLVEAPRVIASTENFPTTAIFNFIFTQIPFLRIFSEPRDDERAARLLSEIPQKVEEIKPLAPALADSLFTNLDLINWEKLDRLFTFSIKEAREGAQKTSGFANPTTDKELSKAKKEYRQRAAREYWLGRKRVTSEMVQVEIENRYQAEVTGFFYTSCFLMFVSAWELIEIYGTCSSPVRAVGVIRQREAEGTAIAEEFLRVLLKYPATISIPEPPNQSEILFKIPFTHDDLNNISFFVNTLRPTELTKMHNPSVLLQG